MGLGVAELMIAIEVEFDIEIFESEAQQIMTLVDLVDLVEKQIAGSAVTEEQAQTFRTEGLRKAREILAEKTGVDPDSLSEDTKLETLFPKETWPRESRRECWQEIRDRFSQSRIPPLENSLSCYLICLFFLEIFVVLGASSIATRYYNEIRVLSFAVMTLVFSIVGLILYGRWNRRADFPMNCDTVMGLARGIISDTIRLDSEGNVWTRPGIEKAIRTIVASEIGVKPEDIDLSVRIDDLF